MLSMDSKRVHTVPAVHMTPANLPPSYAEVIQASQNPTQPHNGMGTRPIPSAPCISVLEHGVNPMPTQNTLSIQLSEEYDSEFQDDSVRNTFLRKVYATIACHLLIILALNALFFYYEPIKLFVYSSGVTMLMIAIVIVLLPSVANLFESMRRTSPYNLYILVLLTLGWSYLTGVLSAMYNSLLPMITLSIIICVCLLMGLFASECFCGFCLCLLFIPAISVTLWYTWLHQYQLVLELVIASIVSLIYCGILAYLLDNTVRKNKKSVSRREYLCILLYLYWCIEVELTFIFIFAIINAILAECCLGVKIGPTCFLLDDREPETETAARQRRQA